LQFSRQVAGPETFGYTLVVKTDGRYNTKCEATCTLCTTYLLSSLAILKIVMLHKLKLSVS